MTTTVIDSIGRVLREVRDGLEADITSERRERTEGEKRILRRLVQAFEAIDAAAKRTASAQEIQIAAAGERLISIGQTVESLSADLASVEQTAAYRATLTDQRIDGIADDVSAARKIVDAQHATIEKQAGTIAETDKRIDAVANDIRAETRESMDGYQSVIRDQAECIGATIQRIDEVAEDLREETRKRLDAHQTIIQDQASTIAATDQRVDEVHILAHYIRDETSKKLDEFQVVIDGQEGVIAATDKRIDVVAEYLEQRFGEADIAGAALTGKALDRLDTNLSGLILELDKTKSDLIADFRSVSESSTTRIASNEQQIDATRATVSDLAEKLADELAVLRSALSSGTTRTDATATAVEALADRLERHVEEMADAELALRLGFDDQASRITDLDQGLQTVRALIAEDIGETLDLRLGETAQVWEAQYRDLAHRLDGVPEQFSSAIAKAVEDHQDQTQAEQDQAIRTGVCAYVDSIRTDLTGPRGPEGLMGRAVHWTSGTLYQEGALVVRRGGIYQAKRPTDEEPGPDSRDWICITNGFDRFHVDADGWTLTYVVTDTIGTEHRSVYEVPHPNPRKTWDPAETYSYYDLVIWDGGSWLATKANPKGEPGKSGDWTVLAMRGPRGPKGERGDMGRMGPEGPMTPTAKVLDAWVEYLNQGNGTPVLAYRGIWTYATRYERGDLVQYRDALHACVAGHQSEQVPGHLGQTNWVLMLNASGGGGSGGSGVGAIGDAYAGSHESDNTAHPASNIVNTPAGNIEAITVQAALNELDGDKAAASHTHGNLSNAGAIGTASSLPIITTTSGVLTAGAFGTGATDFCAGNDGRLSDARTPTAHAASHATGQPDALSAANIGAQAAMSTATQGEMEAGTEAALRAMSPQLVAQAIAALARTSPSFTAFV